MTDATPCFGMPAGGPDPNLEAVRVLKLALCFREETLRMCGCLVRDANRLGPRAARLAFEEWGRLHEALAMLDRPAACEGGGPPDDPTACHGPPADCCDPTAAPFDADELAARLVQELEGRAEELGQSVTRAFYRAVRAALGRARQARQA